jgi:hypothetical protein
MKIEMITKMQIITENKIIELEPRSEHFTTLDGRKGYGSADVTSELSLDELSALVDFLQDKILHRCQLLK